MRRIKLDTIEQKERKKRKATHLPTDALQFVLLRDEAGAGSQADPDQRQEGCRVAETKLKQKNEMRQSISRKKIWGESIIAE